MKYILKHKHDDLLKHENYRPISIMNYLGH